MTALKSTFPQLRTLLLAQRTLRLLLRVAWTGLAGYLLGWGINNLYGSLPDPQSWVTIGLLLALPSLVTIFYTLPIPHLAWNLDRNFELREQLSAAWKTVQEPEPNQISTFLIQDAEALLSNQTNRILQRGWFLSRDFLAAVIIITLFLTINVFNNANTTLKIANASPLELPPLAEAPTYDDLFPSGIPGLNQSPNNNLDPSDPLTPAQAANLDDILSELGETLSQNPETAPAGEALQQGNLEEAATEIERLADDIDELPTEARENAEDALRNAAEQAEEAGEEELAEALQQAADGINSPESNNLEAAEALDELAQEFRKLEEQFAAMGQTGSEEPASEPSEGGEPPQEGTGGSAAGTGNGAEGQSEPLERIEGEGQTVEIEGDGTPSGLLIPGETSNFPTTEDGAPIIASVDDPGDTGIINSILTPFNFPWRWRDVVSKYFSPPQ